MEQKAVGMRGSMCERCGEAMLAIAYGYPGPGMMEAGERGEIALGGCVVYDEAPRWRCPACDHTSGQLDVADS